MIPAAAEAEHDGTRCLERPSAGDLEVSAACAARLAPRRCSTAVAQFESRGPTASIGMRCRPYDEGGSRRRPRRNEKASDGSDVTGCRTVCRTQLRR